MFFCIKHTLRVVASIECGERVRFSKAVAVFTARQDSVSVVTRDIDVAIMSVRLSVNLSVTCRYCIKTA